jgi:Zn-dependent M28 family amino/carboxypeptidase
MSPAESAELEQRLRAHVSELAAAPRPPGSPEHARAAGFVREHLRQAGFRVRDAVYHEAGYVCRNILTEPEPHDEALPLVIVGAHYDSVPDSPGADDNASAVAVLVELARLLRPSLEGDCPWRARVQLVGYDLEEYGMIGSYLHSRELRESGQPLRGMVSLEMLGYTDARPGSQGLPPHLQGLYPDVGNFIGVVGNDVSLDLLRVVVGAMKRVPGLPVECLSVPGNGEALPPVRLSDHSPFWDHGYPALMVTDTSFFRNPHYHQASDTVETLDFPFLAKVTEAAWQAVLELLGAEGGLAAPQ